MARQVHAGAHACSWGCERNRPLTHFQSLCYHRARRRSELARAAKRRRDKDECKRLGRSGGCVITEHLWYFSWSDGFPVAVVHALLHSVFRSLLRFMFRDVAPGIEPDTIVSKAARKTILKRGAQIIPTNDIGRGYKCVIQHLGMYTFEDLRNLALVYGKYIFREPVLPPTLAAMYNDVCTAIEHYLTFGDFTQEARRRAHAALLRFAKKVRFPRPAGCNCCVCHATTVETRPCTVSPRVGSSLTTARQHAALLTWRMPPTNPPNQVESMPDCEHMLTPSLHVLLCRLAVGFCGMRVVKTAGAQEVCVGHLQVWHACCLPHTHAQKSKHCLLTSCMPPHCTPPGFGNRSERVGRWHVTPSMSSSA